MRAFLLALFLTIPATAPANEAPPEQEAPAVIPTVERDFVNSINKFEKSAIVEQFGEPSKRTDIKSPTTGEIIASIWQYRYITTADDSGDYYPLTELDFVGDKVVMVVFMNHDGEELGRDRVEPQPREEEQQLPELNPEISI